MHKFLNNQVYTKIKNNNGLTLVEVVITIGISTLLVLALVTITTFNIRNSALVFENQDALNSSNKLLENLKFLKDTDFDKLYSFPSGTNCFSEDNYCYLDNNRQVSRYTAAQISGTNVPLSYFVVTRTSPTPSVNPPVEVNEVSIRILTRWNIGSSSFSSAFSTIFSNWRQK